MVMRVRRFWLGGVQFERFEAFEGCERLAGGVCGANGERGENGETGEAVLVRGLERQWFAVVGVCGVACVWCGGAVLEWWFCAVCAAQRWCFAPLYTIPPPHFKGARDEKGVREPRQESGRDCSSVAKPRSYYGILTAKRGECK